MLLELAVGDAYGAGFESTDVSFVSVHNRLLGYVNHPWHSMAPGCYTDDTQMSLAVAEVICSGAPWTVHTLASHFVQAYKRDPREGYSKHFQKIITKVNSGTELLALIQPQSSKNGAAMRSAPIGVFSTVEDVLEKAAIQAGITHATPEGIESAQTVALMAHYFLYDKGPVQQLPDFLKANIPGFSFVPWKGRVSSKGDATVQAVITSLLEVRSLSDLLATCVSLTGDTDTIAAIGLAIASCSREYYWDIPDHLIQDLESGDFGRDYLMMLDKKLLGRVIVK